MRFLGIDYGERRIGLAYGDEIGVATPLKAAVQAAREERVDYIAEVVKLRRIEKLVVGYPYNMDGTVGFKAREVDGFIAMLEERFKLPVERVDETLTSVQAQGAVKNRKRNLAATKKTRATGDIDSSAASLILQDYLDRALDLPQSEF
jgi:putative holliday junction resolvase